MLKLDDSLSLLDLIAVARRGTGVGLAPAAKVRMLQGRLLIEQLLRANRPVYGVTTGFGKFQNVAILPSQRRDLQNNLTVVTRYRGWGPLPTPRWYGACCSLGRNRWP